MVSHTADQSPWQICVPPHNTQKPVIVPVGLNFGPTWLSTVFFHDDSQFTTRSSCGSLYESFFDNALCEKVQCDLEYRSSKGLYSADPSLTSKEEVKEFVTKLSEHIKDVISEGALGLGNLDFKLMAVTVPDHWGQSARAYVATATKLAGYALDGSHMIIPLSRAIQSAYQMSKTTYGRYLTLIVDYNEKYLHLMLVEMCGPGCTMKGQAYFPLLGENDLHKPPVLGNAVPSDQEGLMDNVVKLEPSGGLPDHNKSIRKISIKESPTSDRILPISDVHGTSLPEDDTPISDVSNREHPTSGYSTSEAPLIDHPSRDDSDGDSAAVPDEVKADGPVCHNQAAHFKPILDAISEFMILMTRPESPRPAIESPTPRYTIRDVRHAVRNVEHIVIDGEASCRGRMDLTDAIKSKFSDEDWINVQGHKWDCGAYGAALAAKRQWQNPMHLGDWKDLPGYVPGGLRDRTSKRR